MANGFTNDWLEELKTKCGIREIVSQYIQLTKKGGKYFGCCPFHNEKTASFCVNEDGQFYHCFGCGESGDVVKFVMEMESCSFMDACKILAEKVNMTLPEYTHDDKFAIKKEKKEILENCMHDAAEYYYSNLRKEQGKLARTYLENRGISSEVAKYYWLGLSLSYDGLTGYLRRKGYTLENLRECGLIDGANNNDAFANRIIVPISNAMGKIIAFGGRIYQGEENRPKYKNSTNTAQEDIDIENKYKVSNNNNERTFLFDKSKTLYGLNFVKAEKQKNGLNDVILVEGYMDVIALGAKGIVNAVAGMGTALTSLQAKELVRLCKNVLVCYDGDSAGHKAAIRNVETLIANGAEVKIISLPEGKDPDDYVREFGADGFLKLSQQALPLVDFKLSLCENTYGLSTTNGKAKYGEAAVKVLSNIQNETERAVYAEEVAKKCGINAEILSTQIKKDLIQKPTETTINIPAKESANIIAEQAVLHYVLFNRTFAKFDELQRDWFTNISNLEIYDFIEKKKSKGESVNAGMLYGLLEETDELNSVVNFENKIDEEKLEEKYYFDCVTNIADVYLKNLILEIGTKYEQENDAETKKSLILALKTAQDKLKLKTIDGKKYKLSKLYM